MLDIDLTFPNLKMGTHQVHWDMKILLYKGAAGTKRNIVLNGIDSNGYGHIQVDRLPLVRAFYDVITAFSARGCSRSTIISDLEVLWRFYAWADLNSEPLSEETIIETFKNWTESLIERVQIKKDIGSIHAHKEASRMSKIIARALNLPGSKPGVNLLNLTRMRKPSNKKKVLSTAGDKQNLSDTFAFGHVLSNICEALNIETVRGRLPIKVIIDDENTLIVAGSLLKPDLDIEEIKEINSRKRAEKARAPLQANEKLLDRHKRSGILNLRIESELLIFIAQTGMNLSQATKLNLESYRWQTNGEDLDVFRVYKGRRSGEAVFRCFKAYREHLDRYLVWLNETGLSENDNRFFPLVSRSMIRSNESRIHFSAIKDACNKLNISLIGAQALRKTRVNWLIRRSRNLNLTAEQAAHDKETLLRDYIQPHHQSAAAEIVQFHTATDPAFTPPGPGICIDQHHEPEPFNNIPEDAPNPDCISPEGCLFCVKHRDVMSADYCWKLTSHALIKELETNLFRPSRKKSTLHIG